MSAKALLSASVSAPPAVYVEDVFSTYLYTGNGSTQTITNGIDLAGEGGLVWTKNRTDTGGSNHFLFDSTRNNAYYLQSNSTGAQDTLGSGYNLVFNSNGFTDALVNQIYNGVGNASWTFRKAAKFFDVVTYTGTGSARTVAHNLGSVPGCMIVKRLDGAEAWRVYHQSVGNNKNLVLNTTVESSLDYGDNWNNTSPTSTQFSLGPGVGVNQSGATYVAYLFASNAGGFGDSGSDSVISCGSYTGNGSSTGPTVTLGWEPQWLLVKVAAGASGTWCLVDNMRGVTASASVQQLSPNSTSSEVSETGVAFTSTGFSVNTTSSVYNYIGATYIYIAIRRGPMKAPTVGTEVLESVAYTGDGSSNRTIGSSLTPDFVLWMDRDATTTSWSSYAQGIWDRIRGEDVLLSTSNTNQESPGWANQYFNLDQQVGWSNGTDSVYTNNSGTDYVTHHLRRAPGFFDVVAYTGTGSFSQSVTHNLNVEPQLIIIKRRSTGTGQDMGWHVFVGDAGTGYWFIPGLSAGLNLPGAAYTDSISLAPNLSATTFRPYEATLAGPGGYEASQTYIAYLFATCPGVSKVGSYTGTGTTLNIDCGFTAGARFVLIKRTDSTGDWYVWDTARGIVSGNDPYLLLNSTAAEVTGTDYIDPLASGFQISSTAPAAINASGGSFIFLAIA
jgi:hypothetical protein